MVKDGCGFGGEHQYSERTMEEVVNRRLGKRRKRKPDGKTHTYERDKGFNEAVYC